MHCAQFHSLPASYDHMSAPHLSDSHAVYPTPVLPNSHAAFPTLYHYLPNSVLLPSQLHSIITSSPLCLSCPLPFLAHSLSALSSTYCQVVSTRHHAIEPPLVGGWEE